jgi:hypothetical protein
MHEDAQAPAHSIESSNESADRSDNANKDEEGKNSLLEDQPVVMDVDKSDSKQSVKSSENESANAEVQNNQQVSFNNLPLEVCKLIQFYRLKRVAAVVLHPKMTRMQR